MDDLECVCGTPVCHNCLFYSISSYLNYSYDRPDTRPYLIEDADYHQAIKYIKACIVFFGRKGSKIVLNIDVSRDTIFRLVSIKDCRPFILQRPNLNPLKYH